MTGIASLRGFGSEATISVGPLSAIVAYYTSAHAETRLRTLFKEPFGG
jgi:hypothetical protein